MTTKQATGLLPRSDAGATPPLDWLSILAFGAIGWPWLLRSLSGGRPAEKQALLAALELPADALPTLGSWKADVAFLEEIAGAIAALRPATVVELGSGASSLIAARALERHGGGLLIGFDQHADFVEATRAWLAEYGLTADLRAVDLVPSPAGWPGRWYDLHHLPERIDLLIVDGPPWTVHPFVRGAAAHLFDRIPPGGIVLLDDAARPGERVVAARWRKEWPDFDFRLDTRGTKGTLIGTRRR